MQATLPEQVLVYLGDVSIHLRKLHAGVRPDYCVNRQAALDHQEQERCTVFAAGQGVPLVGVVYDQKISSFLSYIGQDLYTDLDKVTVESLCAYIDAACARIGDAAFLSGGVERLRQVERRNQETARRLLEG